MFIRSTLVALLTTLGPLGCSAVIDADTDELGSRPVSCVVGVVAACACLDGTRSTQICNVTGRFDNCRCAVGTAGTGGQ